MLFGASPKSTAPFEDGLRERHTVNWRCNPKWEASWFGNEIGAWPNPATPWTVLGRPFWARKEGAHEKRNCGTLTIGPKLGPRVA